MRKILFLVIIISITALSFADVDKDAAKYGFKMMDIPSSVSMLGSGFCGSLTSDDVFAFGTNPATSLQNDVNKVGFSTNSWLFDTTLSSAGFYRSFGKYGLGAQFRYLDYGKMQERLDNGDHIGDFEPLDMHIQLNYAYRINPSLYLGVNGNIVYEKINTATAYAFAGDLGLVYLTPINGFKIGLTARNMGTSSKMDEEKIDLPFRFEGSLAYEKEISQSFDINTELNISKSSSDEDPKEVISAGFVFIKHLEIRTGYMLNYDENDYTVGFGVDWGRFNIDYAYIPSNITDEDSHSFGLSLKL